MFLVEFRGGQEEGKISAPFSSKKKKMLSKFMPSLKNNNFLVELVAKLVTFKKFHDSDFGSSFSVHPLSFVFFYPSPPGDFLSPMEF